MSNEVDDPIMDYLIGCIPAGTFVQVTWLEDGEMETSVAAGFLTSSGEYLTWDHQDGTPGACRVADIVSVERLPLYKVG